MDSFFSPSPEARQDPVVQLRERLTTLGRTDISDEVLSSAWDSLSCLVGERVGSRISAGMSEAEQAEFNMLIDAETDDDAGRRWLENHFPHYRQVVQDEIAIVAGAAAEWFATTYARCRLAEVDEERDV